jgi:hypothetical protein
MASYEFAQTPEMLELLINTAKKNRNKETIDSILELIINCEYAQTQEMLDLFIDLNPPPRGSARLLVHCKNARTSKMIKHFKNGKPAEATIEWVEKHLNN